MTFETKSADAEAVATLIKVGLPLMEADGRIKWSAVEAAGATEIGYSRGWLILRRAWIEANAPELLVDTASLTAAALAKHGSEYDLNKHVIEPVAADLRDRQALSWGEIAVRLGMPESRVRKAYTKAGVKKDVGLRIGKGGRFYGSDPTLYLDNMKTEGAWVPTTIKGRRPTASECLNFKGEEAAATPKRRVRKSA